ncbi:MAG: FAD-dependent oxidoreductase [bacterium]
MSLLNTEACPLRVAVVGAGPSGFYAVDHLFKSSNFVSVDLFDALPTPYGLLRGGVAPDHQKMKSVAKYYERVATKNAQIFNFFGNIEVGKDITVDELKSFYDAIIFSYGSSGDRLTGLPGENLQNIHSAREFVAWYNGHPDFVDLSFDLSCENVVVIGQGNVAIDVARILAKTPDELKETDIPEPVLDTLAQSQVRNIFLLGRRSPVQVAFTELEIKELGQLADCAVNVDPADLVLTASNESELRSEKNIKSQKNFAVLEELSKRSFAGKSKTIHLKFFHNPVSFSGTSTVSAIRCEKVKLEGEPFRQHIVKTGEAVDVNGGLVFRSIGYKGLEMPGLPFDHKRCIIPNDKGQVIGSDGQQIPGIFTSGWIKRGPSGVIGTNKPCSTETVTTLLSNISSLPLAKNRDAKAIFSYLDGKGLSYVTFDDWLKIDSLEVSAGQKLGKPREKFLHRHEFFSVLSKDYV